ncbi:MAG: ChaN family lipoprotein [Catalinimonas sp.]
MLTTRLIFSLSALLLMAPKPAYRLFDAAGQPTAWEALVERAAGADVVLYGELHNDALTHWLQRELLRDLHARRGDQLLVGMEMFEADDQIVVDEYFAGLISDTRFEQETKLWNNYATDYRPLLAYARAEGLPLVATNVPRRYASLVAQRGPAALDSLDPAAKAWLPDLPVAVDLELPGYRNMIGMMGDHGDATQAENLVRAQALKDAAMAHRIARYRADGQTMLHFNGAYHSDDHGGLSHGGPLGEVNYEGIGTYLRAANPDLRLLTISTVTQSQLDSLAREHQGRADFIVVVPENAAKTY